MTEVIVRVLIVTFVAIVVMIVVGVLLKRLNPKGISRWFKRHAIIGEYYHRANLMRTDEQLALFKSDVRAESLLSRAEKKDLIDSATHSLVLNADPEMYKIRVSEYYPGHDFSL